MLGLLLLAGAGAAGYYGYKEYKLKNPGPMPTPKPPPAGVSFSPASLVTVLETTAPPPPFDPSPAGTSGAWRTNSSYIRAYQGALTYLAGKLAMPSLNPQGVDGIFGPHTQAAVAAFQGSHGLAVDGEAGKNTATALSLALSTS